MPSDCHPGRHDDYTTVTELPGHGATREQISMLHTRYRMAAELGRGRDVLELACGPGVGLGTLAGSANRVVGGDFDPELVRQAAGRYGDRVEVERIDAQALPYGNHTFDVILLLEAIYYLPDAGRFVAEARRVLRPGGQVMICTANRERPDFNPSPFTHHYYSAAELADLLAAEGFETQLFGAYPVAAPGIKQRLVGALRRLAVACRLIPRSMAWKIRLKRLVFGRLEPIPTELSVDPALCRDVIPLRRDQSAAGFKVVYAIGRRAA